MKSTRKPTSVALLARLGVALCMVVGGGWGSAHAATSDATTTTPTAITVTAIAGANDIGVGANGAVWYIANDSSCLTTKTCGSTGSVPAIYQVTASGPQKVAGGAAIRIAVDPNGIPWTINSDNAIYRWSGAGWSKMPGAAIDIGIGGNGTVWVLGTDGTPYRWDGSNWVRLHGVGVSIAVDPQGNPWVVNAAKNIFRWSGSTWAQMPGEATDIAIDSAGGVYVVGGGGQLYRSLPSRISGAYSPWEVITGAVGLRVGAGAVVKYASP